MEKKTKVEWSGLPKELWQTIGKFLNHRLDVLLFRSVCKLWRSSILPLQQPIIPPLPHIFSCSDAMDPGAEPQGLLLQATVYRMKSIVDEESDSSKPWLVKFEESQSGDLRLMNPITNKPLRFSNICKHLNVFDFEIVELHKSYSLNFRSFSVNVARVNKVVVLDECNVFMIYNGGRLGFVRFGDEKWTYVDKQNSHYDDIIVYKGQCYVVDRWGTISWINPELKLIQFSPPLFGLGRKKHLVQSCGDLYVVDRYLDKEMCEMHPRLGYHVENNIYIVDPDFQAPFNPIYVPCDAETIDFKVYKLDQEWGAWVHVKYLADQVFILSNDESFSVSTSDFAIVEGNCILFSDTRRAHFPVAGGARSCPIRVFNLEDGRIRNLEAWPGFYQMLSPPSTWLSPD